MQMTADMLIQFIEVNRRNILVAESDGPVLFRKLSSLNIWAGKCNFEYYIFKNFAQKDRTEGKTWLKLFPYRHNQTVSSSFNACL
jgi:hypothetical protein